jgi:Zn-finger nucleic acid-binding protein
MQCPVCKGVNLMMSDRQGIEIDYCPQCRGVWLDRGELDKIIERSVAVTARPEPAAAPPARDPRPERHDERRYPDERRGEERFGKRRESFLSELFDFD